MTKVPDSEVSEGTMPTQETPPGIQADMDSRSNTERLAIRFAPYIQELRSFFKSRGLPFGSPEDIVPLVESLGSPGSFREEMTSMVRSVVFRERGVLPRNELLELVLIASGGAEIDQAAQEIVAPVALLYDFVGEIISSLKRKAFVEVEDDAEAADGSASFIDSPADQEFEERTSIDGRERNFSQEPERSFDRIPEQRAISRPLTGALARAQLFSPHFEEPAPDRATRSVPPKTVILDASDLANIPAPPAPPLPVAQHFFRNSMCILFFALTVALLWRHWYQAPLLGPSPSSRESAAVSDPGVPSRGSETRIQSTIQTPVTGETSPLNPSTGGLAVAPARDGLKPAPKEIQIQGSDPSPATVHQPSPVPPPTGSKNSIVGGSVAPPVSERRRSSRPPQPGTAQPPTAVPPPNSPAKQGAFLVSSGVMDGNLITSPALRYPKWASMAGVEGQVILQVVVSRKGAVVATHALGGPRMLRGAAARAVKTWRYRPYIVAGKPADIATIVILDFRLPH